MLERCKLRMSVRWTLACGLLVGCSRHRAEPAADPAPIPSAPPPAVSAPPAPVAAVGPRNTCPDDMAFVPEPGVCVQKWEAELVTPDGSVHDPYSVPPPPAGMAGMTARAARGVVPQGYVGRDQAETACRNTTRQGFHYRLCSKDEWQAACRGPARRLFPYGTDYRIEGYCNTHKFPDEQHLVLKFYPDAGWTTSEMNDRRINQEPGGLARTGSYRRCTNAYGVFDLVGNLQEWVSTLSPLRDGRPAAVAMGDHYMGQGKNYQGCEARDVYHPYYPEQFGKNQRDYSRGIRCCADPQ
jgi:sulfatase modifying factor 1